MMTRKRVVIVEDNVDLLKSYALIIKSAENFEITGEYTSFEAAIKPISNSIPDIILMDINLPGINGIEATMYIKERYPPIEVIILTMYEDDDHVLEALRAGASGYILKGSNFISILDSLNEVVNGGAPITSRIAKVVFNQFRLNLQGPLSFREREVLSLQAKGMTYTQMSKILNISSETVKSHIRNIYKKLKVNNRSSALSLATKEKYI